MYRLLMNIDEKNKYSIVLPTDGVQKGWISTKSHNFSFLLDSLKCLDTMPVSVKRSWPECFIRTILEGLGLMNLFITDRNQLQGEWSIATRFLNVFKRSFCSQNTSKSLRCLFTSQGVYTGCPRMISIQNCEISLLF